MQDNTIELLEDIRWLSDSDRVQKGWLPDTEPTEFVVDAPEYYSILFDDLKIKEAHSMEDLSTYQKTIILEFARAIEIAAKKDRALYDVARFIKDPHFLIAQKIASLL